MADSFNDKVKEALALLPPEGQKMEFDEYKAKLYSVNPDTGKDVFTHLIKRDLIGKVLDQREDGSHMLNVFRLPSAKAVSAPSTKK